ncbi:C39 family peptidase [Haloarchaeobius sp. DYHT-AS-18]|uniref:C39 family peptidase n=1 Tax=Haloarchaeobius sp. DYHT-AS-18 TaxID=3446117 RepID=UPI003EB9B4F6
MTVSSGDARRAAKTKLDAVSQRSRFDSWRGATLAKPTTFHAKNAGSGPAYVPVAYTFSVRNAGEEVGYITASARADWAPILEYSTATSPDSLVEQAQSKAAAHGHGTTGRLLYHGGVKYGLELGDGRAMNVRNGRPTATGRGIDPADMGFDSEQVAQQRNALQTDSVTTSDVTIQSHWDTIYGVPAWTEHDDGNSGSTSYGTGDDSWDDWDGCVPVAASMIIAYHEGFDESDTWWREYLIDRLHDDMNTNDAGSTWPTDIDDGFDKFSNGSHSYNGRNIYLWNHPDFTKREISDNSRPFLLNMNDGGSANDRSQNYGDHSTTVVGYASNGDELELHDTWDDSSHYLTWGSWSECSYTKVTKS